MVVVNTSHGTFIGLKRGKRGPYVKVLQQRLNNMSEARKLLVTDGVFGRGTERALENFQKLVRLPVTGSVDEKTDLLLLFTEMGSSQSPVRMPEPRHIDLANHVGRNIATYCAHKSRTTDKGLHCAHWISHVLEYPRASCGPRSVSHYGDTASDWMKYDPDQPSNFFGRPRLIYVAKSGKHGESPFTQRGSRMTIARPRRHIGILLGNKIFHYENGSAYEQVVCAASDRSGSHSTRFIDRYGTRSCEHWTSAFPPGMIVNITNSSS